MQLNIQKLQLVVQKLDLNLKLYGRKCDIRNQQDLYVNNLVGDIEANPRDFIGRKKKIPKVFPIEIEEWKRNCTVRI